MVRRSILSEAYRKTQLLGHVDQDIENIPYQERQDSIDLVLKVEPGSNVTNGRRMSQNHCFNLK